MKKKYLLILFFVWGAFRSYTQPNFQKVYLFADTFAIFNDVYATDTCYYYSCTSGKVYQRESFNFGKIHFNGNTEILNFDYSPTNWQDVGFSYADMQINFRNNFVTTFTNYSQGSCPRIKEVTKEGIVILDTILNNLFCIDSLNIFDAMRLVVNNTDSTYLIAFRYYDNLTDSNNPISDDGEMGTMVMKIKYDGTEIWRKRFRYTPTGLFKPWRFICNFFSINLNQYLLIQNEFDLHAPSEAQADKSKIIFTVIDENGNTISENIFQDTPFCFGKYGAIRLVDNSLIISYYDSQLTGSSPNLDHFEFRPAITRLDANSNVIWKINLFDSLINDVTTESNIEDFKLVNDTLFVGAYYHYDKLPNNKSHNPLRIVQYSINGNKKWHRDYTYFPIDLFNDPMYEISDLEITPDGGYIMAGQVINNDSMSAGVPGQFGYILKTNCLGFLGSPEAEISYTLNSDHTVQFVNNSLQAGSYTWCFGDGDTLHTGEQMDTINHLYTSNGIFEGKLIAEGCNGETDTSFFTLNFSKSPIDTSILNGNYFTIFPNPIESNSSFSVYLGNVTGENVQLIIHDELGRVIQKYKLDTPYTNYIIPALFSIGKFTISLYKNDEKLEVEDFIIY
ncbi:MAG: PKD domain-containing protein [Flavobacteriia bacterium]|nr:PKD domain-containing protein [Flavobacteriia bacterium]